MICPSCGMKSLRLGLGVFKRKATFRCRHCNTAIESELAGWPYQLIAWTAAALAPILGIVVYFVSAMSLGLAALIAVCYFAADAVLMFVLHARNIARQIRIDNPS